MRSMRDVETPTRRRACAKASPAERVTPMGLLAGTAVLCAEPWGWLGRVSNTVGQASCIPASPTTIGTPSIASTKIIAQRYGGYGAALAPSEVDPKTTGERPAGQTSPETATVQTYRFAGSPTMPNPVMGGRLGSPACVRTGPAICTYSSKVI